MNTNIIPELEKHIKDGFHRDVKLTQRRPDLFQVKLPYYYPDGDMVEVFLQPIGSNEILIQDMGITLMRLSYDFNMDSPSKKKILNEIISQYQVDEKASNLSIISPKEELFPYLMQFLQVVTKVSDISFLKREVVKSLFYEYFDKFMFDTFSDYDVVKEYYPEFDREKQYPTPYALIKKEKPDPVCFYPIASDEKCNETTITIQHYELNDFRPDTIAVFENQEEIGRKPLARVSNIVGKQFASLQGNEKRIRDFMVRLSA